MPKGGRAELVRLKRETLLVDHGIKVLSAKRDALHEEFLGLTEKTAVLGAKLVEELREARHSLVTATCAVPASMLDSAAIASEKELTFGGRSRNVWGVRIPSAAIPATKRDPFERGSAPGFRDPAVDETAWLFEKVLKRIMECAIEEKKRSAIGADLRLTTRRVNSLEMRVAPELKKEAAGLRLRLEEIEREDLFRLKRFKMLAERQSARLGQ